MTTTQVEPAETGTQRGILASVLPYVQIARTDHWFKNSFMILGVILALFYEPQLFRRESVLPLLVALAATCLIASSNYVLNELLDGPRDRLHPEKRHRPRPPPRCGCGGRGGRGSGRPRTRTRSAPRRTTSPCRGR